MRTLTLFIKGEEKKFTIPFVSGMVWRKWIELRAKIENLATLKPNEIDQMVELIVYAFGNQFSLEEFYEGVPHDKVLTSFDELFLPSTDGAEGNGKK